MRRSRPSRHCARRQLCGNKPGQCGLDLHAEHGSLLTAAAAAGDPLPPRPLAAPRNSRSPAAVSLRPARCQWRPQQQPPPRAGRRPPRRPAHGPSPPAPEPRPPPTSAAACWWREQRRRRPTSTSGKCARSLVARQASRQPHSRRNRRTGGIEGCSTRRCRRRRCRRRGDVAHRRPPAPLTRLPPGRPPPPQVSRRVLLPPAAHAAHAADHAEAGQGVPGGVAHVQR